MTELFDLVMTTLTTDVTLTALLTGGVYDEDDVPSRLGITPSDFPDEIRDANGRIKPFAWIVWHESFENRRSEPLDEERQVLDVYVVSDFGYDSIRAAVARVKEIMHRHSWVVSDYKFAWSRHYSTMRGQSAKDFLFAPFIGVAFEFVLRR